MCTNDIKKRIYDDICDDIFYNCVGITNFEEYAMHKTELILKFEGCQNCKQCSQYFESTDLSKYLNVIKDEENECVVIIATQGAFVKTFCFSGNKSSVPVESYFVKGENSVSAVEFIVEWYKRGAKICNYHNHPLRIAAIPSNEDIAAMEHPWNHSSWSACVQKYGIDIPVDFQYDDWGVVTPYDFFSKKQYEEKGGKMIDIIEENDEKKKLIDAELQKYIDSI